MKSLTLPAENRKFRIYAEEGRDSNGLREKWVQKMIPANKLMKKMVALALAITMLMSLESVASASTGFSIPVSCTDTTNYTKAPSVEYKSKGSAAIYVIHHDNVDTTEYTNHFRGIDDDANVTRGSKWCTQGLNVPIQNNNIKTGKNYTVSGRGNTNYYNNDGISRVTLSGTFDANR